MSDTKLAARLGLRPCERVSDTDPWCQGHDSIWRSGSRFVCDEVLGLLGMAERGMDLVTPILTDLITELRETAAVKPGATGRLLMEMVGSAEARLREVTGDE